MTDAHGVARDQLRAFIERIERLEEEKKSIADDIKDVYGEAKGMGYDTKILREVIKIRKQDRDERAEREAILDSYLIALGMIKQPSFFDDEPRRSVSASREERRRQLMSEDMAVHKNLVDEMADAGMISEEARHENKALADAVATKFGNGPAMPLRSDGGLSILTKHEDIRTAPVTAEEAEPEAAAEVAGDDLREPAAAEQGQIIREGDAPRETGRFGGDASCPDTGLQTDRAAKGSFETGSEAAGNARKAIPAGPEDGSVNHAGAGESPATENAVVATVATALPSVERVTPHRPGSADANTGGSHVTGSSNSAATTAEGHASAPSAKRSALRPHCLNPGEACGGWGSNHCHACKLAMKEKELA